VVSRVRRTLARARTADRGRKAEKRTEEKNRKKEAVISPYGGRTLPSLGKKPDKKRGTTIG